MWDFIDFFAGPVFNFIALLWLFLAIALTVLVLFQKRRIRNPKPDAFCENCKTIAEFKTEGSGWKPTRFERRHGVECVTPGELLVEGPLEELHTLGRREPK